MLGNIFVRIPCMKTVYYKFALVIAITVQLYYQFVTQT